jgi:hypothetical protein
MTASDDSDTDSERGVKKQKNVQILNKLPPLVSCRRKHNIVIGKLGMVAYIEKIFKFS